MLFSLAPDPAAQSVPPERDLTEPVADPMVESVTEPVVEPILEPLGEPLGPILDAFREPFREGLTPQGDAEGVDPLLDRWQLGPLYHEFNLTLHPGHRREALGPLYSYQEKRSEETWGVHPIWSYHRDKRVDFAEMDFVYPYVVYDRYGEQYRLQVTQFVHASGGISGDGVERDRFSLFPFLFLQRASEPEFNYWAVFPLYGNLQNRFLRDEIFFVMFPAYSKTRKREVVTWNYFYPVFHVRRGGGVSGWQVWPLFMTEEKRMQTERIEGGERVAEPGYERLTVLWPVFHRNRLGIGSENPLNQLVVLPFYSRQRSPLRDSTSYLWPFGFTYTEDRGKEYREWGAPWPFVVFARGKGKTGNRIWPLFSHMETETLENSFYLWPIYKRNQVHADRFERDRVRILFFLYSDLTERNVVAETERRRTALWPLFTAEEDHQGDYELQLLSLLEPIFPNNRSIARNYAPVYSIWRTKRSALKEEVSHSFLWNLYRYDRGPEEKKVSLLFGLFRYQSGPEGKRWRVFYIPFGGGEKGKEEG